MTSPVERISGPEHGVDVGEAVERAAPPPSPRRGRRRPAGAAGPPRAARSSVAPTITRRADLGQRHAGGLGHERHRAAGPGVGLDHEHLALLHRVLHVDQAPDVERVGDAPRVRLDRRRSPRRTASAAGSTQAESPECTPASSTCSITPPMSTSPVRVPDGVDVDLDGVLEEAVDEHRTLGREPALAPERAEVRRARPWPRRGPSSS